MARSSPTSPRGDKWIDETSCDIRHGLVDDCTYSRLILIFMEYYLMPDKHAYAECKCPMLRCRKTFPNAREMLTHLKKCERIDEGEFRCPVPDCREVICYPTGGKKECSWTHSKTPIHEKISRFTHRFSQSSGKSKSSPQSSTSLRRESSVSWMRKGRSPGDSSPFSPDEVGRGEPSAHQQNEKRWDAHPWEHNNFAASSQPNPSSSSHQRVEVDSDRPASELPHPDRVSKKAHDLLDLSAQPPQYVDSSTNTPKAGQQHPPMRYGGWSSNYPTIASISPQSTVYHDGHRSVGTGDTYEVSLSSSIMSRNSTRSSPVSEMAVDDGQLFGGIPFRRSTSPQHMDHSWVPPPVQTSQLAEFPGNSLTRVDLPDSPRPVAVQQLTAEMDSSSTPTSSRVASGMLTSTDTRAVTQNLPTSSISLPTPPSTRSNSGDDKGSSALGPLVELPTFTNEDLFSRMLADETAWWVDSPHIASLLAQQVNEPFDVSMSGQLLPAPDSPHQLPPPPPPPHMSLPDSSALPSQALAMANITSLQQPVPLETVTCPDLNCSYTREFDPAQPAAARDAVALLRRHRSRKLERQAGPHICSDCRQVFTRNDNIRAHQRNGRCPGPEGPSRFRGPAVRRANARRGLPPLVELG